MKKILLLSITSLAMLMADFTLIGEQLTPVNEPVAEPIPEPTPVSTTGSAKTNWGFQGFTIPSDSVTVSPGGNIQAAIDSLPNGGTVNLEEGIYYGNWIMLKSNIVIQGAGKDLTEIRVSGNPDYLFYANGGGVTNGMVNIKLLDFTINSSGTNNSAIVFLNGVSNVLVDNLVVHSTGSSGILVNNFSWAIGGGHFTFRNTEVYNVGKYHGLVYKYVTGGIIDSCHTHDLPEYGMDLSRAQYIEVTNSVFEDSGYGAKFPGCNFIYVHDTIFRNNVYVAIKLQEFEDQPGGKQYIHLKNLLSENSGDGFIDWGATVTYTFEEMVLENITTTNTDGSKNLNVAPKGANDVYEYTGAIGMTVPVSGWSITTLHQSTTTTPEEDGVGWTSWPSPQ